MEASGHCTSVVVFRWHGLVSTGQLRRRNSRKEMGSCRWNTGQQDFISVSMGNLTALGHLVLASGPTG